MRLVKPNRGCILNIDVQPDGRSTYLVGRAFHVPQKLTSNAQPVKIRKNLDGLNIRSHLRDSLRPFNNGKSRQGSIVFRDPSGCILRLHEPSHVAPAKCQWWLKADFLDAVNGLKVFRLVEAVVHLSL